MATPFSSVTVTASLDNGDGAGGGQALTEEVSKKKIASFCQNRSTGCLSPFGERALLGQPD
jgi:hypothetical protein